MQFSFPKLDYLFIFAFAQQNSRTSFSRMADHSYNVAKEAIESPEMVLNTTQWGLFRLYYRAAVGVRGHVLPSVYFFF